MSAFSKFHPAALLTYFAAIIVTAAFIQNPIISAVALVGGSLFCVSLSGKNGLISDLKLFLPIFCLITVTNPLFSHSGTTELFAVGRISVTLEALLYGVQLALMTVSVMLWCKAYSLTVTEEKFVFIFGKPFPKLSLVLSAALRYIPMLKRQAEKINRSRKAAGLYSGERYSDRVRSALGVFSALISRSLEQAIETSRSMKARGYGAGEQTLYHEFQFGKNDAVLIGLCALSLATVISGELEFDFYPQVALPKLSPNALMAYTVFAVTAIFPFALEVTENLKFKYFRSKI